MSTPAMANANNNKVDPAFVRKYLSDHGSDVFFVEHNRAAFSNHLAQVKIKLIVSQGIFEKFPIKMNGRRRIKF